MPLAAAKPGGPSDPLKKDGKCFHELFEKKFMCFLIVKTFKVRSEIKVNFEQGL